ncbi:MAG: GNAT family N-acetyltransferase [Gracilimonas sp.]|uniref:GNAT family N-acetyltransferase n=1 Tax=Gracilimonas sp. TaxID=1974203 RepID=UPI0037521AC5|nr:GNAT family N-acetyltransferase [Gracilimonas sp.]
MKIRRIERNDPIIEKVISLGDKYRKTLGHFPEGAFREHANKRLLFVAENDNELCGYILFRVVKSKQTISITHLCISEKFRGNGLGAKLLSELCNSFKNKLRGITLSCREDYKEASKLWESFGFKAVQRKPGRGKKETYLNVWWYDFGNPDLFSVSEIQSDKLQAVLDANILIKLREISTDSEQEIKSLDADWLNAECEFYFAPELYNEIKRDSDKGRAEETRKFVRNNFQALRCDPELVKNEEQKLKRLLSGSSANDISDRKQLAECIASNLNYFITTDQDILEVSESLYQDFGVNVYRPIELILQIDSIKNAVDYASLRVEGANYDYTKIKGKELTNVVDNFLRKEEAEKKSNLKSILLELVADTKNSEVKIVRDGDGNYIGIFGLVKHENHLEISILRVVKTRLAEPLFHQLILDIIRLSKKLEKNSILIYEPHFSKVEQDILKQYGFSLAEGVYKKISLNGVYDLADIFKKELVARYFNTEKLQRKIGEAETEELNLKVEFEKKLWPVKIRDLGIPTYIVPIKPTWAKDLFDYRLANETIFGSKAELIWSNENVYYRSVNPVSEKSPARILWYLSSGKNRFTKRKKGIVATSYLDEVKIDTPKELYREFKHYGVYKWRSVYQLASQDLQKELKVLKFSFTEVFRKIIKLEEVNKILIEHGRSKNTFASPLEVSKEVFNEIYTKGISKDE